MSLAQNPSPARRYVNCFLLANCRLGASIHVMRESDGVPVLESRWDAPPPSFERFRNRLKIMANLDPVCYPVRKQGRFELSIPSENDGGIIQQLFAVEVTFDDAADDPSVEVRFERLSSTVCPGPDPVLY